ncbi:MAG: BTAD domain-containing putative transcriptional regulator [Caldilineaceae bacterium]
MAYLALKLFGSPEVNLDGDPLHLEGRIPVALLAYLAVTGQLHTRDALATLFWPESDQARTQLRNNLWVLKRDLGAWGKTWLANDHETIGLLPNAPLWVDVRHFQTQLAAGQAHVHSPGELCADCLTHYNEAATLYRADFLAGFTLRASPAFDEWQFFQQEGLRRDCAKVLETLVQYHRQQGEFTPAIHHARRWLALDPLHEPAHRTLMHLYAETGEYAAALRQYQTCKRHLQTELQAPPDPETEALYQAIKAKQQPPFPGVPLQKSAAAPVAVLKQPLPPNNLLEQLTPLVGRAQERRFLQNFLRRSDVRLVTLTGTGGIGKTRLALQVAADLLERFGDGAYFVPLVPIREANLVLTVLAQTLNVHETGSRTLVENVVSYLQDKALLLVLDNFEHVVSTAPLMTDLLARCPQLKILVTSREVLHLRGEHEFSVPALGLPVRHQPLPLDTLTQSEAVQLFIQRAQAVKPDFTVDNTSASAVAEICVRLDGLPLAIELAAARCKFFSPQALLQKLTTSSLAVLRGGTRDMPARHQTLRDAIAWSYDLLNLAERKLFQQLAVFVGGFTLEAVEAICALETNAAFAVQDCLLSLVDKNLVRQEMAIGEEARFTLLETMREFGLEQLTESGELLAVQQRHASYYSGLAHLLCPQLMGKANVRVMALLRMNFSNIRTALQWLLAQRAVEDSLSFANILLDYWTITHSREGIAYLEAALALAGDQPPTPTYINTLASAGFALTAFGAGGSARHYFEQCLALNKASGNIGDPKRIGMANGILGWIHFDQGDYQIARAYMAAAKENDLATGDEWALAMTLANQGKMEAKLGEFARANEYLQEALAQHRRLGDVWAMALTLTNQSLLYVLQNKFEAAAATVTQGQTFAQEIQAEAVLADIYRFSALIALDRGEHNQVNPLLRKALLIRQKAGTPRYLLEALDTTVVIAVRQNESYRGLVLAGAIRVVRQTLQIVGPPVEKKLVDDAVAQARQQLTDEVAATAWAAGEAMTLDEAVAYALAT